ncbi:fimbrial protein [Pseudomonas endophytica]
MKALSPMALTASLVLISISFNTVMAAGQGSGVVTLGGEIVDTACALETGSAFQIIEMDPVPVGRMIREGEGDPHSFSLRLVNCSLSRENPNRPGESLPDWQHVRVTFEGVSDREGRSFAAFGSSRGVALHILDELGQESAPGVPMPMVALSSSKEQVLHYTLRLVGNDQPMSVGSHSAAVRFRLEYY